MDPLFPIPNSRDSSFAARYGFIRAERRPGVDAQRKMHSGDESGGLQRYIDDGVSGYWIDDLATDLPRLIRLLEVDPARATGMGQAARHIYEQQFSLTIAASAFENVLASVPYGATYSGSERTIEAAR